MLGMENENFKINMKDFFFKIQRDIYIMRKKIRTSGELW